MKVSVVIFVVLVAGGIETLACRDDWVSYGTSCYAFVDERVTWSTAVTICGALKARLVEVNDAGENAFLASAMQTRQYSSVWTGVQDFLREGRWVTTSDQMSATYFHWAPGEPNNDGDAESGQDCAVVRQDGAWDDYQCDSSHQVDVVCEYECPRGGGSLSGEAQRAMETHPLPILHLLLPAMPLR